MDCCKTFSVEDAEPIIFKQDAMRPPSLHANFFSSLKQVEKRLKSENPSHSSSPSLLPETATGTGNTSADSLSSPIYLNCNESNYSSAFQCSDPPQEFLSHSLEFPPSHDNPPQSNIAKPNHIIDEAKDDIQRLIELLGLSENNAEDQEQQRGGLGLKSCGESYFFHGGFYSKIVGVKGPKCKKEMDRLDGWINYFSNDGGGEKREPFRLVHLLLGRAACFYEDNGDLEGLEFPPTVEDFLQNDPPTA